jgi:lipid II:glycine glycyltransferase (peptidoglycan interpeptide bridge formation enzyme)
VLADHHKGYDAVYYFNCQQPSAQAKEKYTVLIDLSPDPEAILKSFRKSTRKEIIKAMSEDRIECSFNDQPSARDIESYINAHSHFTENKQIDGISDSQRQMMFNLHSEGKLIISTASTEGEILSQFAMIDVDDRLVCKYGYNSRYSYQSDQKKMQLCSQANRMLEYQSMLYAKQIGKKYYDLCGITLNPDDLDKQNVDQYKLGFRGTIVTEYHFMKPVTWIGRIFCWTKAARGGI